MSKVVLITGAGRGIGLELTKQLASSGWIVFATCRSSTADLNSINLHGGHVIEGVNVTSKDGISIITSAIKKTKLDLLINNAGVLGTESLDSLDVVSMMHQFEVNSLSPLLITAALLENGNLLSGSKIAMISSMEGSMSSRKFGGIYGYRMSKAALNMGSVLLAKDLEPKGISVLIIHPGSVATDMSNEFISKTGVINQDLMAASESAKCIIQRIELTDMASSGKFFSVSGEEIAW